MLIFVESGFVYSFFWLSQLDLFFDFEMKSDFLTYLHAFLNSIGDQISGIYPTAIIILVHIQRSISDDIVAAHRSGRSTARGYEPSQSQQSSTLIFQSRVTKVEGDEMTPANAERSPGV
ncbi:hypothetical protein PM082_001412 [Marasmius tenuissimus]|nr:hypothetical protein PM082_001412 [Marasmius tenuissimus]